MREVALSTVDNPFNPFGQWDEWYAFDLAHGYNSCSYLARIAVTSNELSDEEEATSIEAAVDEIVRINPLGIFKKVVKDEKKK